MLSEIAVCDLQAALDETADEILQLAECDQPPVDAFALASALGIDVAWDHQQAGRARCVRLKGDERASNRPSILVRPDDRPERIHWAVAHEIGEFAARGVFERLAVDARESPVDARESTANQLASRLLLPGRWFGVDAPACDWELLALKRTYSTASHELIGRRMLDFVPPVIVTIYDHGRATFRRSNVLGRVAPPLPLETACWQRAHCAGRPQQRSGGRLRVRAWPVHETGWKREILRTELTEFETD